MPLIRTRTVFGCRHRKETNENLEEGPLVPSTMFIPTIQGTVDVNDIYKLTCRSLDEKN